MPGLLCAPAETRSQDSHCLLQAFHRSTGPVIQAVVRLEIASGRFDPLAHLSAHEKRSGHLRCPDLQKMIPAMTYFRTGGYYHRPYELNGRVRNGNVCFLTGIVTGKPQTRQRLPHSSE